MKDNPVVAENTATYRFLRKRLHLKRRKQPIQNGLCFVTTDSSLRISLKARSPSRAEGLSVD